MYLEQMRLWNLLAGRTITLVGGLDSAIDKAAVEAADLVVRLNAHGIRQNGRCHAVYSSAADSVAPFERLQARPLWFGYRVTGLYAMEHERFCVQHNILAVPFDNQEYPRLSPHGPEFEWSNIFAKEVGAKPFTGLLAIRHLTLFPIKALYITGMDFHTTSTDEPLSMVRRADGLTLHMRGPHAVEPQVRWLWHYITTDSRVCVDQKLAKILGDKAWNQTQK